MHDETGFAAVHRSFEALLDAFGDDAAAEVEISVENLAVAAIFQSTYLVEDGRPLLLFSSVAFLK